MSAPVVSNGCQLTHHLLVCMSGGGTMSTANLINGIQRERGWHHVPLNVLTSCLFFSLGSRLMELSVLVDMRDLRSLCSALILNVNL